MPEFEGKVKCIYIDPPYNTGNEGWVYNDAVNDPKIKRWLGQVVGKEGEDLSRHDKWLCMMYPRLKLLHRLLADDGLIFVSIDDTEIASIRLLLDEIFGASQFIANFIWEKRKNRENRKMISVRHDYVLCYAKQNKADLLHIKPLPMDEAALSRYRNPDNDERGPWKSDPATAQAGHATKSQFYQLIAPNGKTHDLPSGRCWIYTQEAMADAILDGRIWFGESGNNVPRVKTYLDAKDRGLTPETILFADDVSTTEKAKNDIKELFDGKAVFETPKPVELIEHLLKLCTSGDDLILDSFAGSGTTGQAVVQANAADGGRRRFVLVEMMEYAHTITAERVRRVILRNSAEGELGGFDYYTVGEPMFLAEDILNEAVGVDAIRNYVAYSEGIPIEARAAPQNPHTPYLLGLNRETGWIFYYEPNRATSLDMDFLSSLRFGGDTGAGKPATTIIYADRCLLSKAFMTRHGIVFKKIPRDITRF
ncbi:site-specific DNA-methyltransferase [Aquabacterium sp.]|uniref:site-specific DNA-methyltransferase n=1 Tax=Aquabacterium sp. TaxID=1872578 RepID=UPI0035AE157A